MDPRVHKEISDAVFGRTDYEPIVTFYDHASYNEVLSKASGRPRFIEKTYTLLKPTHPDLKVRDEVSHPVKEEEKLMYPRQWAAYQKTKQDQLEFKVPLQAVPGMGRAAFEELQALQIFDAESLVNYTGDLGEIDHLRELAIQIMEVSDAARDLHRKRQTVREDSHRQQYNGGSSTGQGFAGGFGSGSEALNQASQCSAGAGDTGEESRGETFRYTVQVN